MKNNIKYIAFAMAAALSAVACTKEIIDEQPTGSQMPEGEKLTINAISGELDGTATDTKAVGVYGYQVLWEDNDRIAVTDGTHRGKFELIEGARTTAGKFSQAEDDDQTYGNDVTGFYPASLLQEDGSLAWPYIQKWSEAITGMPMTASASLEEEEATFNFKSLGGVLQLVLTTPSGYTKMKTITISAENAGLSGKFTVTDGAATGLPDGSSVTLDCYGLALGPAAKTVYIGIPANDYTNVQLRFVTEDNRSMTLTSSELSIKRGVVSKVSLALFDLKRTFPNYLSFTAQGCDIPLNLKKHSNPDKLELEYSFDPEQGWEKFTADSNGEELQSITTIAYGKTIYLRGAEKRDSLGKEDSWWTFDFGGSAAEGGRIIAGGDVMSLLDPDVESRTAGNYAFIGLFSGAAALMVAPDISAESIGISACESMYSRCNNLPKAPYLPAESVGASGYKSMFESCTSLSGDPIYLPAEKLGESSYENMFKGCKSMTISPLALPVDPVPATCYAGMFQNCTSLLTVPKLPATSVGKSGYKAMFASCTSITKAPVLSATELSNGCYEEMFNGCSSLESVQESLSATKLSDSCYRSMFKGCTSLTAAPALPATELSNYCYMYMFKNCTALKEAPALPAKTLTYNCYDGMFMGCKSLVKAPHLPARTIGNGSYVAMFGFCSSLKSISVEFSDWTYPGYHSAWLEGVSQKGTFYCPVDLEDIRGRTYIPQGWTINRAYIPDDYPVGSTFKADGVEAMYIGMGPNGKKLAVMTNNLGASETNLLGDTYSAAALQEVKESEAWKNAWRLPTAEEMEFIAREGGASPFLTSSTMCKFGDGFIFFHYSQDVADGRRESRNWLADEESCYWFRSDGKYGRTSTESTAVDEFYVRLVKEY